MTAQADRNRLCSRYPAAMLIQQFVDSGEESLEILVPEPGTVLDNGVRFLATETAEPTRVHSHFYTIAQRGGWLKTDVWIRKAGRSVWLYNSEEAYLAAKGTK